MCVRVWLVYRSCVYEVSMVCVCDQGYAQARAAIRTNPKEGSLQPLCLLQPSVSAQRHAGVWDDHDMGLNDAGKDFIGKHDAQALYLDFLKVPTSDPRRSQQGVYWSRRHNNGRLQVIALDTRSHRDHHYIPSVGAHPWVPFGGLVASAIRFLTAWLGWGRDYTGDVLGDAQWEWLENVLRTTPLESPHQFTPTTHTPVPDLTVVISSIQVITSNPLVESWGHFPIARRRLLRLLQHHRRKGVLLLSGDVHLGEMANTVPSASHGTLEVTSSGLTHSCATSLVWFSCSMVLRTFGMHRQQPDGQDAVYPRENFGLLDIDWAMRTYTVSVHSVADGTAVLSATRSFDDETSLMRRDNGGGGVLPDIFVAQGGGMLLVASVVCVLVLFVGVVGVVWLGYHRVYHRHHRAVSTNAYKKD